MATAADLVILALGGVLAVVYLFRASLFGKSKDEGSKLNGSALANGDAVANDFVSKLQTQVSCTLCILILSLFASDFSLSSPEKTNCYLLRLSDWYR